MGAKEDAAKIKKQLEAVTAELKKSESAAHKLDAAVGEIVTSVSEVKSAATGMTEVFMQGFGNFDIGSVIQHVNAMSQLSAEMNKATGQAGQLSAALKEHRKAADGMAVGYAELTTHMTAVYSGMTDFSKLSPKMQGELAGVASKLTKMGISAEDTAKNLDIMTRGLGMTAKQAGKTQMDIARMARSLGVTPKKMAADFAAASPKLAGYGKQAFSVFKKLAAQAKATGLEMNELLGITDNFDTFEGAAEQTAQLNAIMGTTMNSVDMLMASEDQRIKMMKSEMNATGKRWDSMDRFERKALANIVTQGNMEKAARLFGTSLKDIEEQEAAADPALVSMEALNDAMKKGVSRGDAFAAMLEGITSKFAAAFMPLVNTFTKFFIREVIPKLTQFLKWIELKIKALTAHFDEMGEEGQFFKDMLGWVIAIAVGIGPILGVLGAIIPLLLSIGGLVAAIFSPWTLALVGIAMAITLVYENWEEVSVAFKDFFQVSWPAFKGGFMEGWNEMWGGVKETWMSVWTEMNALFVDIADALGLTTSDQTFNWKEMGKTAAKVIGQIATAIGKLAKLWVGDFRKMATESGGVIDKLKAFFGPGGSDLMFHTFSLVFLEKVARPMAQFADKILGSPVWSRVLSVALGYASTDPTSGKFGFNVNKMKEDFGLARGQTAEGLLDAKILTTANKALAARQASEEALRASIDAAGAPPTRRAGGTPAGSTTTPKRRPAPGVPKPAVATTDAASPQQAADQGAIPEARFVIYIDGEKFVDKVINPHRNAIYGFGTATV